MAFRPGDLISTQLGLLNVPPMTVVVSREGYPIICRGDGYIVDRHGNVVVPKAGTGMVPYKIVWISPIALDPAKAYANLATPKNILDGGKP